MMTHSSSRLVRFIKSLLRPWRRPAPPSINMVIDSGGLNANALRDLLQRFPKTREISVRVEHHGVIIKLTGSIDEMLQEYQRMMTLCDEIDAKRAQRQPDRLAFATKMKLTEAQVARMSDGMVILMKDGKTTPAGEALKKVTSAQPTKDEQWKRL